MAFCCFSSTGTACTCTGSAASSTAEYLMCATAVHWRQRLPAPASTPKMGHCGQGTLLGQLPFAPWPLTQPERKPRNSTRTITVRRHHQQSQSAGPAVTGKFLQAPTSLHSGREVLLRWGRHSKTRSKAWLRGNQGLNPVFAGHAEPHNSGHNTMLNMRWSEAH